MLVVLTMEAASAKIDRSLGVLGINVMFMIICLPID